MVLVVLEALPLLETTMEALEALVSRFMVCITALVVEEVVMVRVVEVLMRVSVAQGVLAVAVRVVLELVGLNRYMLELRALLTLALVVEVVAMMVLALMLDALVELVVQVSRLLLMLTLSICP